jgi:hypothetical protein
MNISELISELENKKNEIGDVPVFICTKGFGGYTVSTIGNISESAMYSGSLKESSVTNEDMKNIFPEWDAEKEVECICLELITGLELSSD